ncbi:helix-turn-helix domain-containing protein [Levilactobacillus namurensis]|uniref:helix-turn-helix domain-containing protein n=1 Tax=Levilactobacillus namurensis TaxID=380393 RepID=UPI000463A1F7|nr:helix-turn-helix transcriptional regulator [Levilactobacillus namurensis]MCW3778881.1 helix-turn-helix domain-containing protein [Levilactobacillus namurensis]MDT7017824.1 helix-turn-helix transcriptional regulator [Levilactobacillus namurensis]WNN65176.1 helix-turn-helix transcriptional regulator [Levilactobacillus namurensis]
MDIDVFIARRKELKLSQVKLCEGICTQATLSKFENNNRIPSLTILSKLCARLGMTVDNLYQSQKNRSAELAATLNLVENQLMTENYRRVLRELEKIDVQDIDAVDLKMQFYYLRGIVNTLVNREPTATLFDFSRILNDLDERHQTILTQLAFMGSGILYARLQQRTAAAFYFERVRHYIETLDFQRAQPTMANYHLRVLMLIYFTAEFYAHQRDYRLSNRLLQTGLVLCSDQHVTYYLPRLKFLAAQNALAEHRPYAAVNQQLDEALAFAHVNHNEVIVLKIAALRSQLKQRETASS